MKASAVAMAILREGGDAMRSDWCDDCGCRHSPERRQGKLRKLLPRHAWELKEAMVCEYSGDSGSAGDVRLYRDLRAIGAVRGVRGVWVLR